MLVVILKTFGYVFPYAAEFLSERLLVVCRDTQPSRLLRPVMVDINYNVHILFDCVIHDILNAAYPFFVYGVIIFVVDHRSPCHGYSHGVEARVMHRFDKLSCSADILPLNFVRCKSCMAVHRIAEVPAHSHFKSKLLPGQDPERQRRRSCLRRFLFRLLLGRRFGLALGSFRRRFLLSGGRALRARILAARG